MNSVAYGFRDDITDDEVENLIREGVVFECQEHGVFEERDADTLDAAIERLRIPEART